MIFTERTITVVNDSATINKPLILYRGDKNIELKITIAESQFKFRNTDASNVIETTDASYAQLVINTPYNSPIFSDVAATKNGAVIFVITEAMIDEIREVGAYEIQIRLLDDNKQSRASIPPVSNAIEIREPIAMEDGSAVDSNAVNVAKVNRALTTTSAPLEAFDSQGNYIKKTWGDGDPITDAALNKMEAGIDGVNKKVANNSSQINQKANINDIIMNGFRNYSVDMKYIDFAKCKTVNIDSYSLTDWNVEDNVLSPLMLNQDSFYILDKTLIDGKLTFQFTNSNFGSPNIDALGICFMGNDVNNHIRVNFYTSSSSNKIFLYKIKDGVKELLDDYTIQYDNLFYEDNLYNNVTIELIGCNFSISLNGEKIITRNNTENLEYLKEHNGFIAFFNNSKYSTSQNFKVKNIRIEEYDYKNYPFRVEKVSMIGDSIMYGSGASELANSWGGLLKDFLLKYNIKSSNFAVGGNNLNAIYYQLKNNVLTEEEKPQVLICSGGTNDCRIDNAHLDIDKSFDNLSRIVKLCKVNDIIPIVCTIIPFRKTFVTNRINKTSYLQMLEFNERIIKFADREKIRLIDNYYNFNIENMTSDNIHPNDDGHKVLFENTIRTLFA